MSRAGITVKARARWRGSHAGAAPHPVLARWPNTEADQHSLLLDGRAQIYLPRLVSLPDPEAMKLHVLDTDYTNYMVLCVENAAAPGQGLACQYLGTRPGGLTVTRGRAGGTGAWRPDVRGPGSPGAGWSGAGLGRLLTRDRHAG